MDKQSKCKKCGVMIADKTKICPLCHMVLTVDSDGMHSRTYPNITKKRKLWARIWKIAAFVLAVLQVVLIGFNVAFYHGVRWSLISGVAIFYLLVSLYQFILYPDSLVRKLFKQTLLLGVLLFAIDCSLGFLGWSYTIGVPCILLSLDVVILICMIVEFRNWQNYLLLQLFSLIIALCEVILWCFQRNPYGLLAWITFGVTAFFFSFCVFFGSAKAKNELQRRFYI